MGSFLSGIFSRTYFGLGFLALENIAFNINRVEEKTHSEDMKADDSNVSDETKSDIEDVTEDAEEHPDSETSDVEQKLAISNYWKDGKYHVTNEDGLKAAFNHANTTANISVILDNNITVSSSALDSNRGKVTIDGGYIDVNGNVQRRTIIISGTNSSGGSSYFRTFQHMIAASNGGMVALMNLTIDANNMYPSPAGNAVVTAFGGTITTNNCLFKNVNSGGIGGINAIEARSGTLVVKNTTITDSKATGGVCAWQGINNVTCENVNVNSGMESIGIAVAKQGAQMGNSVGVIKDCIVTGTNKGIHISDDNTSVAGSSTATIQGTTVSGCTIGVNVNNNTASVVLSNSNVSEGNIYSNIYLLVLE